MRQRDFQILRSIRVWLISEWRRAVVICLLLVFPAVGKVEPIPITFTRVVDTNTRIPGGKGNFIFFTDPFTTSLMDGRPAASIENGIVVFSGSGASGQRGIYAVAIGGLMTTIADTNTTVPGGTNNFRWFGTPSISQGNMAFSGAGELVQPAPAQGAYFATLGGSIKTVVDRNTLVPGGIGNFRGIGTVKLDDGSVGFVHAAVGRDRIFVSDSNGQITLVADSEQFGVFNGLSFADGIVAFIARQSSIYAAPVGGPPVLIADSVPGQDSIVTGFNPSVDNGAIGFLVGNNLQGAGIYIADLQGSLTPVALVGTPVPDGTGSFTSFDSDSPSQRDGIVAFRGFGTFGQEGIYASIGGSLVKVIDLSGSLDGKSLNRVFLGYEAVSGNQIVFAAQFADGSRGIYVAQLGHEPSPSDNDADGVPNSEDECPHSNLSATVVIDSCNSDVPNSLFPSGCTVSDLIAAYTEGASNHGEFVSRVSRLTNDLKKAGTITGQQQSAIQSCAAQADVR